MSGNLARARRILGVGQVAPEADPIRTAALGMVAVSTAVLSFSTLMELGRAIGLAEYAAWLFPIGFDAAVLGSTRAWLHPKLSRPTRRYAAAVAVFTITASVAGNSIWHWRTGVTAGDPLWWIIVVIAFSALIPFVLGLVVHLAAMIDADARARRGAEAETAAKIAQRAVVASRPARTRRPAAAAEPEPLPDGVTDVAAVRSARHRIEEVWRAARAAGQELSYVEIDRKAGTTGYAKKIIPDLIRREEAASG